MTQSGIAAVGDSITAACSRDLAIGGLPARSYAELVAEHLGESLTVVAKSGATSQEIRTVLLPQLEPGHRLGLVFVGTNNVVSWKNWRRLDLASDIAAIVATTVAAADRVLVLGVSENVGSTPFVPAYGPGIRKRVRAANAILRAAAARGGAEFVALPGLVGDEVWIDRVHPTSLGHRRVADTVLRALTGAGLPEYRPTPLTDDFVRWRRREAVRFWLKEPPRGMAKWLIY